MATDETAVHADTSEKSVSAEEYTDAAILDIQSFSEYLSDELGLTSTSTYPSSPPTFIDLPEILSLSSEFHYNYYTRDERTVSTGEQTIVNIASSDQNVEFIKKQNKSPRSVILKIRSQPPPSLSTDSFLKDYAIAKGKTLINTSTDKIVFEGAIANSRFSTIILKDNQVDDTFYNEITGSVTFSDAYAKSDTDSQFMTNLTSQFFSPMAESSQTTSTIRKALSNSQPKGVAYAPADARFETIAEALRDVRFVEFGFSINNAVISNVVLGALEDRGNIYQDELMSVESDVKLIQDMYVAQASSYAVDSSEFELEMAPVYTLTLEDATLGKSVIDESSYPIGYYVEKTEIQAGADSEMSTRQLEPIIIDTYGDFNILDSDIRYGATYLYNVKVLYLTAYEASAIDPDGATPDEIVFAISMVASEGVKTQTVAIERIPPEPPQNLRFNYNFQDYSLDIFWEEPTNPQRDVVRYQILRRGSIEESFVLLAEYDFDMSTSKVVPLEIAPPEKIYQVRGPRKHYKDLDFKRSESYIYAMACVDARGLTSEYSEQVLVSFNSFKNKIVRKRISPPGAPKSYPNLYLKTDLFVDTIKSSESTRMRVFFDPEYYDVLKTNTAGEGKDSVKVDTSLRLISDMYKLQIINIDLQNAQTFDIAISDQTGEVADVPMTSATVKTIF